MDTYEQALLTVAREYANAVNTSGGKSLARVSTIVANRGSFFDALEKGATCSVRNFEKFAEYFGVPENWPGDEIPAVAQMALNSIGRPARPAPEIPAQGAAA
jgi:hypothetical protein